MRIHRTSERKSPKSEGPLKGGSKVCDPRNFLQKSREFQKLAIASRADERQNRNPVLPVAEETVRRIVDEDCLSGIEVGNYAQVFEHLPFGGREAVLSVEPETEDFSPALEEIKHEIGVFLRGGGVDHHREDPAHPLQKLL